MMPVPFQERTVPYLKPIEVEQKVGELQRLRDSLGAPLHIRNQLQDVGTLIRRRNDIQRNLEENAPKPYVEADLDSAVARKEALLAEILQGMPTQAEMRRAPPGAVDKHMKWEQRNKPKILEWKNIEKCLHVTGDADAPEAVDTSNLERYRPSGGAGELSLDNAVIPGKSIHLPPKITIRNTMSDEDRLAVKLERYRIMAEQGDEHARMILAAFADDDAEDPPTLAVEPAPVFTDPAPSPTVTLGAPKPPPPTIVKKGPTEKQVAARAAASERLKKMHAERKARKAAALKDAAATDATE